MSEATPTGAALAGVSPPPPPAEVHYQFEEIEQQRDAGNLGMWVFLATEVLFFGGLFATYTFYRSLHFSGFEVGSHLLERSFGAAMTFILLGSSFTMALSIHAIRTGRRRLVCALLVLTILLGAIFLGIKFTDYDQKWHEHLVPGLNFHPAASQLHDAPGDAVDLFFCFYFFMTGLHAVHMIVGIGLLSVMTIRAWRKILSEGNYQQLEVSGLYWHFVDIIWIFLFPLLYLIGGPH